MMQIKKNHPEHILSNHSCSLHPFFGHSGVWESSFLGHTIYAIYSLVGFRLGYLVGRPATVMESMGRDGSSTNSKLPISFVLSSLLVTSGFLRSRGRKTNGLEYNTSGHIPSILGWYRHCQIDEGNQGWQIRSSRQCLGVCSVWIPCC